LKGRFQGGGEEWSGVERSGEVMVEEVKKENEKKTGIWR
jgi:hypothetical protein